MSHHGSVVAAACRDLGLDLAAGARVGQYNDLVAERHALPDYADPSSTVILIGNTRRLWPAFVAALVANPRLLERPNPLDDYVEDAVRSACDRVDIETRIRWAHRAEPAHISFQTLAEVCGLAWRSPASLSIHPVFGPWIALRAAIVLPVAALTETARLSRTCHACDTGCAKRLAMLGNAAQPDWNDWLAVRDACPVGREYRYSAQQIAYHYTKSRDLLHAAAGYRPAQ